MALKIVIGTKEGKSLQEEIADPKPLVGKKIGGTFKGEFADLPGYELQITGGSDDAGFPMRRDVQGSARFRIFAVKGIGVRRLNKGQRQRKNVAGNTITPHTAQINAKVTKAGEKPLFEAKAEGA